MKKKRYKVQIKCSVIKELTTKPCSPEEARNTPWLVATHEQELEETDWEVLGVQENA